MARIHATCVAIGGRGVLLRGASGSGKSDLALRLIDRGAVLVADDQVIVEAAGGRLTAAPPPVLAGLLEVRGLGIVRMPWAAPVPLALAVDLHATGGTQRMPEPAAAVIEGIALPLTALAPFEASAPVRTELALALALDPARLVSDRGDSAR